MAYSAPFATLPTESPPWSGPRLLWSHSKRFNRSVSDVTLNGPSHYGYANHDGAKESERAERFRHSLRAGGLSGVYDHHWERASTASGRSSRADSEALFKEWAEEADRRPATAAQPEALGPVERDFTPGASLAKLFKDRNLRHCEWNSAAPHPGGTRSRNSRIAGPGHPFASTWDTPMLSTTFSSTGSQLARTTATNKFGPKAFFEPPPMMVPLGDDE
eukprot:CAMPEP_0115463830 /NCGR_PEP_ID=MMETSP0271-20121206/48562_1 /TAXON_ID=71861 /ORGANISM="Scrippsiella trochoidea, Strain CCMP3099" /LENGTH=217 /DNA_ID=CAMNT_0002890701 /DNA_START=22 /DNA_END=673 /DNA_ORIENTATION=-